MADIPVGTILVTLRPGDRLGNGLVVAREEPTEEMRLRGEEEMGRFVELDESSYPTLEAFSDAISGTYKAMLAALDSHELTSSGVVSHEGAVGERQDGWR